MPPLSCWGFEVLGIEGATLVLSDHSLSLHSFFFGPVMWSAVNCRSQMPERSAVAIWPCKPLLDSPRGQHFETSIDANLDVE
ncbi:hypothetical protein, variant 2 [Cryptococcus amylolentus CBS 6039]|uniref:Uncharacterized protein n=1 Tax=Cryptococcus amylolentus CBS 6039 TaxID=1295533 RepID=A0A1E3I3S2_9TREE|nr:hypothetical protein, variant 1 [Cryptococcus amylolentus CBS 6039]XP_018997025.1 hypothetical protein, variant 2 [Cryptococcus amylolentus CBS 6039]ODN83024.1 hypothetical protein, variant 1 [Cryptococcus amylolentus CBS 6039]ODN83025.1 hypothetical protein, variant 2 [Cryptococcus amylolentus CBS 6039]